MSLIDTWLMAGKDFGYKTNLEILSAMNDDLGSSIKNNKIYEWRNGSSRPSTEVTNYMLQVSILYALKQLKPRFKLTNEELDLLLVMLSIPEKVKK